MINQNPAWQLHAAFQAYQEAWIYFQSTDPDTTSRSCWASALEASGEDVPLVIGRLLTLIPRVEAFALAINSASFQASIAQLSRSWAEALLPPDRGLDSVAKPIPEAALATLHILGALDPVQVRQASPESLHRSQDSLRAAIDAIRADSTLPLSVRSVVLQRLADIVWAIDHISLVGEAGVREAAEKLASALVTLKSETKKKHTVKLAIIAGWMAWSLFSQASEVRDDFEAWKAMLPAADSILQDVIRELPTSEIGFDSPDSAPPNQEGAPVVESYAVEIVDGEIVDEG